MYMKQNGHTMLMLKLKKTMSIVSWQERGDVDKSETVNINCIHIAVVLKFSLNFSPQRKRSENLSCCCQLYRIKGSNIERK